jgi:acid phosphatase type 7
MVTNLNSSQRVFHTFGDSGGVMEPGPQAAVVKALIEDLVNGVEFAYHLGDEVYFEGELKQYVPQFFEAYAEYLRVLCGISGNHDALDYPTFVRYFCDKAPQLLPEVAEYNRDTMDQPNVYWTLEDDLVTIIGLATNVPSGGQVDEVQRAWLAEELKEAPEGRTLIVALHHPPYSCDTHHGGSQQMGEVLDGAFNASGRCPDLVLSGHVHNYQSFTRAAWGRQIPYVVVGNGGYHNLHGMAADAAPGLQATADCVLEAFDDSHWGFLRLAVTATEIAAEYIAVDREGATTPNADHFVVDLEAHTVSR